MDSDDSDQEGWDDNEEVFDDDDENTEVQSLFCSTRLPTVPMLMEHDLSNFGFNLTACCHAVGDDDISLIMLVNFIRLQVQSAIVEEITPAYAQALEKNICENPGMFLGDEKYMQPVLRNADGSPDPLLYLLREALHLEDCDDDAILQNEEQASSALANSAQEELMRQMQSDIARLKGLVASLTSDGADVSLKTSAKEQRDSSVPNDAYYFDSYGELGIHETMLRDKPRTMTYGAALLQNPDFVRGKTVLDVGCGTGILCMFAAKAGAKKVVGVDLSSIIERSKRIVQRNGYADVITLVRGRLEATELPLEIEEADIIVSEWMGYGLYFENMLSSVLYARDKYLNKTAGVLMPSKACIYVEAMTAEHDDDRLDYWSNVYGFDMQELRDMILPEAQVQHVPASDIISSRCLAHELDIGTATDADLDFEAHFSVTLTRESTEVKAFVISFDTIFGQGNLKAIAGGEGATTFKEQCLSTGAQAPSTHWRQTVLWLNPNHRVKATTDMVLRGSVTYARSGDNKRNYNMILRWMHPFDRMERVQAYSLAS